ncbi:zinc ribbon domain-containing protein [Enterococcus plantarum]|uniref:zinc ribbon domain-containing protein n=1 Tax=Enterococcus plantarum TaxID=1077675 RepID=UPI001A8F2D45|nr:zinc ribbon domain-containing protein [Enterococcus plantarum]MBO0466652.1 zinc ribbon domain-containing protein [Enterococcus plantarum]
MYCNKCGTKLEEAVNFCSDCGDSQSKEKSFKVSQTTDGVNKIINEVKKRISSGQESGKLYMMFGWITTIVSLLFIPVLFGAVSVIMGYLYRSYDEKHGTIIMISGVAGAILGFLLGIASVSY